MSDAYYSNGGGNSMPSYQGDRANAVREIRKLWKRLEMGGGNVIVPLEKAWSYSGVVNPAENVTGQPWIAPANIQLANLQITLAVASSTSYSIETRIQGSLQAITTVTAGFTGVLQPLGFNLLKGQQMTMVLLSAPAGTGEMMGMVYRYESIEQ